MENKVVIDVVGCGRIAQNEHFQRVCARTEVFFLYYLKFTLKGKVPLASHLPASTSMA